VRETGGGLRSHCLARDNGQEAKNRNKNKPPPPHIHTALIDLVPMYVKNGTFFREEFPFPSLCCHLIDGQCSSHINTDSNGVGRMTINQRKKKKGTPPSKRRPRNGILNTKIA